MPIRLKSLELHGYKTFAVKVDFEFAGQVTAIVGPNGSGKSNIADALRWVLGEQSYSLLRAKKTEDMIFAGSEQRSRAGMASATVLFDNSDGWLPVDFSEVAVTRRAYRDGHNEYLLNGQHVRLRDVFELLAQSGLSERTYTILGQGLVDASLALKADERRRLFEEAAGIGLYRTRREESLRRLETTLRNLDRVLDIMAELEPRVKSLERQARRAQEFSRIQADLRVLLLDWYGYHWHAAQRELTDARSMAHDFEVKIQQAREAYQGVRDSFSSYRDRLQGLRARLNSWHRQSAQLHNQHERISRSLAVLDERRRSILDNLQAARSEQARLAEENRVDGERLAESESEAARLLAEFDEAQVQMAAAQEALENRQAEMAEMESRLQEARKDLNRLTAHQAQLEGRLDELKRRAEAQQEKFAAGEQALGDVQAEVHAAESALERIVKAVRRAEAALKQAEGALDSVRKRLIALETTRKTQAAERAALEMEATRLKTQIEVLDQAEQSLAGYADGARLLLEAARQERLGGAQGALSSSLDVPAELVVAVAAALGEYTDAILLRSGADAEQALALLQGEDSGRASLLPLDWLVPAEALRAPTDPDCLGVAADLVQAAAELRPALDLLLGQVLIVSDRAAARRLLSGQGGNLRAVTLQGEVFSASGPVLAGRSAAGATLSRPRQRRELGEALAKVERQATALDRKLGTTLDEISAVEEQVAASSAALEEKRVTQEQAQVEANQAGVRVEAARRQRDWQAAQQESLQSEIKDSRDEHERTAADLTRIETETGDLLHEIQSGTMALTALTLDEFQSQVTYWSTRLAVAERAHSDARARWMERKGRQQRLQDLHSAQGVRLTELEQALTDLEKEKESLRSQERELHGQLDELGGLIEPAEKELESAEAQEQGLQGQEAENQQQLSLVERQYTQIQLDLGRRQEALESLRQKIEDDFGLVEFEYTPSVEGPVPLPLEGMVRQLPVLTELPSDLEPQMAQQKALLRRMGPINPEAQAEYTSVKERFEFLSTQMDDLRKAETDLRQVIAELDELTRREFQKTFDEVAAEFHVIFHRLFGGGSARLVLTDPDNLSDTGIDIEARLPGRREQGLSLLSGGERSLTAIALVFALLKVSPTPVCVMDEVDAMLDEANVGRFRDLLLELSQQTQFVIITHNRNTVQAADVIYGVTMGRDSTSQVISLRLDEVSEEYLK
ncbi:MAG: chromosome segregation protein SMC [Anaerolineales bacterium]|nr:chromosome segregation protein SMC [Anaerolineales bacterium]